MRYLEKSFTIYPSVREIDAAYSLTPKGRKPKRGHEFLSMSGVCLECQLDRIGHETKYGKEKSENRSV